MEYIKNITSPKDFAIVKTIITLAKQLNIKTVAEGVEHKEQMDVLKSLGCDAIQGYYFAKPMPFEEFLKFIKE
jgi:EAL domain-containing protein (putative c-di-GMP-specific phosphodiesterase class I)